MVCSLRGTLIQSDSTTAYIVVSRGHSRWCPAYVESEQALMNTTEGTWQQCSVSFGWQPTNNLTSLPVNIRGWGCNAESVLGVAVGRDAGMSGAGVVSMRSAQMTGQQNNNKNHKNNSLVVSVQPPCAITCANSVHVKNPKPRQPLF